MSSEPVLPADYGLPGMWEQADLIGGETDCDLPARTAEYVAALEKLLDASRELCIYIGTGMEPAPQSMSVTMGQQAVREFRKATFHALKLQIDG